MVFVAKVCGNSYSSVTVDSVRTCIFARGARVEVTHPKFFMVNDIYILSLWNIQLTLNKEESGIMNGIIRHGRA